MTVAFPPQTDSSFGEQSQSEIRALVESNRAGEALERLARHEPRDRHERIQHLAIRARAHRQLRNYPESIRDWTRALHLTSRERAARARIRICLADTLAFAEDFARAERVIRRCVAEIRAQDGDPLEPWALNSLAYLHLRRGSLSLATRIYEQARALIDGSPDVTMRVALTVNQSHALIRMGEYERARDALANAALGLGQGLKDVAPLFLSQALLAVESGDLEGAEEALGRADERVLGDEMRNRLIRLQLSARVALARGKPGEALAMLDEAVGPLSGSRSAFGSNAELSRLRALALLDLGRLEEALEAAELASARCSSTDLHDRPSVDRTFAQCLAAMGRSEEAKRRLATALSLLESTECVVERQRVLDQMDELGMTSARARVRRWVARGGTDRDDAVHRFELASGRVFVTTDAELVGRIRIAAESRLPVLLEGETGTGKELIARLLHETSSVRSGPFVVVDCSTLNETLAEAELFGVARGAYTGAAHDRPGLVGAADGGTLLFDELPELSLSAQSKLLRLLQEGTYRRLGEAKPRHVKVRVIAATNQDAERLLAQGELKPDLFYRLHGHRIRLRPLRDRAEEVPHLARAFAAAEGLAGVTEEAVALLTSCPWPGNARQLEMLIRVAATSVGPRGWLERDVVGRLLGEAPKIADPSPERQRLQRALEAHQGNVAATARSLGMSRQGLYKALHRNRLI